MTTKCRSVYKFSPTVTYQQGGRTQTRLPCSSNMRMYTMTISSSRNKDWAPLVVWNEPGMFCAGIKQHINPHYCPASRIACAISPSHFPVTREEGPCGSEKEQHLQGIKGSVHYSLALQRSMFSFPTAHGTQCSQSWKPPDEKGRWQR